MSQAALSRAEPVGSIIQARMGMRWDLGCRLGELGLPHHSGLPAVAQLALFLARPSASLGRLRGMSA